MVGFVWSKPNSKVARQDSSGTTHDIESYIDWDSSDNDGDVEQGEAPRVSSMRRIKRTHGKSS
jgi:hypothetical protein